MSYCRWSTDDFRCDVYVYESKNGYEINIAALRHRLTDAELPPPVPFDTNNLMPWFRRMDTVSDLIRRTKRYPIGLPFDGESFCEPSPKDAAVRLQEIKGAGYNVPQDVIDVLNVFLVDGK